MQNFRPLTSHSFRKRFLTSIAEVDPADWDALAGTNPFLRHAFLLALETSGSTTTATGWEPCHLLLEDDGGLAAALPLYRKSHSYGEYVFDWAWAEAYHSHGLTYYPKLLTAVPFTPSTASRVLLRDENVPLAELIAAVTDYAQDADIGTWHVLFPTERQSGRLAEAGLMRRYACQFQWFNRNYATFDDFLETFSSRKRKNVRKEREAVREQGIEFRHYAGGEITEDLWQHFYAFYQSTYHMRGQRGYLTRAFFSEIGRTMPEDLLLVIAHREGQPIAGALSFQDQETLYGRYWGSLADYEFLHFETCYYQGIDYCIRRGLKRFDSGAQGEHKIQRGFEPVVTYSNHWIADPRFRHALEDFTKKEKQHIEHYMAHASDLLPFRRSG